MSPKSIFKNPIHFIACGFGTGAIPKAPGTFGTLVAIPLYLLIKPLPPIIFAIILIAIIAVGVYLCDKTAKDFGVHDHPAIVWDEIAGYLVTMIAAPTGWLWIAIGFGLFRLFDIWKPWPISLLDQHVSGGVGIMVDDLLAGLYGFVVMQLFVFWFF